MRQHSGSSERPACVFDVAETQGLAVKLRNELCFAGRTVLVKDDLRPSHMRQQRKLVSGRDEQPARFGDSLTRYRSVFVQQRIFRVGDAPQNVEAGVEHRLMEPRTAFVVDPRELAHDALRIATTMDKEN